MVVTDPFDITVFWKVTRWEYVNVDSVTFRFSTVITWFRCSNYTDRLPLKKYRSTMATSRSQTRFVISQWILLVFLFADECRNPYHCLHTLICSDLKGTEKPLSSSSRRSQAWTAGNKPATNPVRNISVNIACFLFADERRHPFHCLHALICSDPKGTKKPLSSLSQNMGLDSRTQLKFFCVS